MIKPEENHHTRRHTTQDDQSTYGNTFRAAPKRAIHALSVCKSLMLLKLTTIYRIRKKSYRMVNFGNRDELFFEVLVKIPTYVM